MKYLLLIIMLGVCFFLGYSIKDTQTTTTTETVIVRDTITIRDTIKGEDNIILTDVEIPVYDTVYIDDYKKAYYDLLKLYISINTFEATLQDDSLAFIKIRPVVSQNKINNIPFEFINRRPTSMNTNINYYNEKEWFLTGNSNTEVGLLFKNKKVIYSVGYDIKGKGFVAGLGIKIK